MRILKFLPLLASLLLHVGPAGAANLLFDVSHSQVVPISLDFRFVEARAELLSAGHSISSLIGSPGDVTAGALLGYDVFITGAPQDPYSAAEIQVMWNHVAGGGGVILTQDGGLNTDDSTDSINSFLAPYGMAFSHFMANSNGIDVSEFVDHCLLDGITSLGFDYLRVLTTIEAPAIALQTAAPVLMGLYDDGNGWVIALGDVSMWTDPGSGGDRDIDSLDNRKLLQNVFGFANCADSPVAESSWSGIKTLY